MQEQEVWITNSRNGMPEKVRIRRQAPPQQPEQSNVLGWEQQQQRQPEQAPEQVQTQTQFQMPPPEQEPVEQGQRYRNLSPFEERAMQGYKYQAFKPPIMMFGIARKRDEVENARRFSPQFRNGTSRGGGLFTSMWTPMTEEITMDENTGEVLERKKHFFIPKKLTRI